MPKAKFADRGKPKPKSIKAKTKLSSQRKLSRFGKKQKEGYAGEAVNYIARTKAVKKLQISLKDFRRLCILKGIYPRDPKNKKSGNTQVRRCLHYTSQCFRGGTTSCSWRSPLYLFDGLAAISNLQTYYHVKDISYLAHEPLLAKFREFKVSRARRRFVFCVSCCCPPALEMRRRCLKHL